MKRRLDHLIVERGLAPSRARAQAMIRAGLVSVAGTVQTKPAADVPDDADITISGDVHPWVSRGGIKLRHALDHFNVDVTGAVCLDLGASTGGFTEVLLAGGAAKVYAVDVGRGQLHEKLRGDGRVINLEATHAKDLSAATIPDQPGLLVADVSFISLTKILGFVLPLLSVPARAVLLVKPQFESEPADIGKGGIVRDAAVQEAAIHRVAGFMQAHGWHTAPAIDSAITGSDGNHEFLLYCEKSNG